MKEHTMVKVKVETHAKIKKMAKKEGMFIDSFINKMIDSHQKLMKIEGIK